MDQGVQSSPPKNTLKQLPQTMVCLQQNITLPSNLLQKRKNILEQMRIIKTSQNSRVNTAREPIALMSKTFANYRDAQKMQDKNNNKLLQMLIEEVPIRKSTDKHKQKKGKNPLYRRLCDIQAQSKELSGVSFSKLLSRMLVIQNQQKTQKKNLNDYRKKQSNTIDSKLRSIPNYECLQSKLFSIDCPQNGIESTQTCPKRSRNSSLSKLAQPQTNRLFRRYYNPHGQKSQFLSSMNQTIEFDQRYIYKNGKKAECKRIHNFYTSNMFRKSYEKHMGNTIDGFYPVNKSVNKSIQ